MKKMLSFLSAVALVVGCASNHVKVATPVAPAPVAAVDHSAELAAVRSVIAGAPAVPVASVAAPAPAPAPVVAAPVAAPAPVSHVFSAPAQVVAQAAKNHDVRTVILTLLLTGLAYFGSPYLIAWLKKLVAWAKKQRTLVDVENFAVQADAKVASAIKEIEAAVERAKAAAPAPAPAAVEAKPAAAVVEPAKKA